MCEFQLRFKILSNSKLDFTSTEWVTNKRLSLEYTIITN